MYIYYRENVIDNVIYKRQDRAKELIQYDVKRHYEHLPRTQQQIILVKLHRLDSKIYEILAAATPEAALAASLSAVAKAVGLLEVAVRRG